MGKENLLDDVDHVLISEQELHARIAELGKQISHDYKGRPLLLVAVLKGSVLFMADLMRAISIPHSIDFMATSSYGGNTESSGVVRILKDLDEPIEGKDVLIVEDIIDTGRTLDYLLRILGERHPASLRVCALLDKRERREVNVPVHYVGFVIPNEFVIGYGLDYAQVYRNLPFIGVLKPEVYKGDQ
ncbi:MAG: hypoxanthine phosphoribosyltransferase [Anaerolineae bacterium]|nr:hypoxanthine phosphoribosyltransferase [Anaerolineae bacterium]